MKSYKNYSVAEDENDVEIISIAYVSAVNTGVGNDRGFINKNKKKDNKSKNNSIELYESLRDEIKSIQKSVCNTKGDTNKIHEIIERLEAVFLK